MKEKFKSLAEMFHISGDIETYRVISRGNINTTYDVTILDQSERKRFIFQKLNLHVFHNPKRLMKNIEAITSHISNKLEESGESQDHVMQFAHRENGKNYFIEDDSFWRISKYVTDTAVYDECDNLDKLKSAGRAFGRFQTYLSDFDASSLYETIPKFHDTRSRIAVLAKHIDEDPCGRVSDALSEIEAIDRFKALAVKLNELVDSDELPIRVTHNDTKINNVLFDKTTGEAKTVIDLDTVMPGLVAHDFGDAVRCAANTSSEDEPDLSKVDFDLERFRAFAEGFIPEIKSSLTHIEIETMALGAFTMTIELAVRFLDDYITGDKYFKTEYSNHNLIRARCQIRLAEKIYENMDEMNRIILDMI